MNPPKPIRLSKHGAQRALLRGATTDEISETIRVSKWGPALENKQQAKKRFAFNRTSPQNQEHYRFKTVETIFVEEENEIVVITVKVYYSNEE